MWTRSSYRAFRRYIDYFNPKDPVFKVLEQMPAVVSHSRVDGLKQRLAECEDNRRILVHSGDCAEPFEHAQEAVLRQKVRFFEEIGKIVKEKHKKQAVMVGRIAGQYAKPRSSEFETTPDGDKIPSYKGDIVNSHSPSQRSPDLSRLIEAYRNSVITHNYINNHTEELFTSHQGLVLPYEAAMTRKVGRAEYCLSAHMLWIGERTRQLDGAHIEFFRGIANPIGVKVSHNMNQEDFLTLNQKLNPMNEKGKILIIVRMGAALIREKLNLLIEAKLKHGLNFLFVSDPMHANTYQLPEKKVKTRDYDKISSQLGYFQSQMKQSGLPFGVSLQATPFPVTECLGGAHPLTQNDIRQETYETLCDPRLNGGQLRRLLSQTSFA